MHRHDKDVGVGDSLFSIRVNRRRGSRCSGGRQTRNVSLRRAVVEAFEPRVLLSGYARSIVASFDSSGGSGPAAAVTFDSSGNLFGTTGGGGDDNLGTVFEIPKGSTTPTTITSFTGVNGNSSAQGTSPQGALALDSQGNLWGTTSAGGANGLGNVFEIPTGAQSMMDVASFTDATGGNSFAGVTFDKNGNLFGTTTNGGTNGLGTVFEIAKGTTTIKAVASFNGTNGANPFGPVTFDGNGNLFGTTSGGGDTNGDGTIFEIASGSTSIQVVAKFNGANGSSPEGTLAFDSSGNLFGTTAAGGDAAGDGTVFEIVKGAKAITHVANFAGTNGSSPLSGIRFDKNGNLFGTTSGGGSSGKGTVFEILKGTTAIKSLGSLNGTNGQAPQAGVTFDSVGNLFGTAAIGGSSGNGTVFEIASGSTTLKAVASFNGNQGLFSRSAVTIDKSGNLFGTTSGGGTFNDGTVYEIAAGSSMIKTIGSFNGTNGSAPQGDVVLDSSGNLFGTTPSGGANEKGTIYEIVKGSNTIKTLFSFDGAHGADPQGGLTMDGKGNIFGATLSGGASGGGVIFEIPHGSTTMKVLAGFEQPTGTNPYANLAVDSQGNIFGATIQGAGAANDGAVFELPAGSTKFQALATFNGTNGSLAMGDVAVDANGNFFGATISGGSSTGGPGVIYEVVKGSKTITDLVKFNGSNGDNPFGGITLDSSGNLFGTAQNATTNNGEVFEIVKGTKTAQILATFNGTNGAAPQATVKFDTKGNLFGTTFDGGLHGDGNVFKLTPTITLTAPANQSAVAGVTKTFSLGSFVQTGAIGPFTVNVSFSDGTSSFVEMNQMPGPISDIFTLVKAGVTTVTVTVADSAGHTSNTIKFNITDAPDNLDPANLVFAQQPTTGIAGAALSPAITVDLEDRFGNIITTLSSDVTLALNTFPTGGTLSGTTTVKAVNGVATFTGLSLKIAGAYTLKASAGSAFAGVSNSITIAPAAAAKLVIAQQPTSGTHGVALSPVFIVDVEDAFGNIATGSSASIVLALSSNPAGGVLGGTLKVKAVKGIATFGALTLSKTGTYVVKATSGSLTTAVSKNVVVK
jgi:uncharacterized repeat protein (TIGR03803 family)